MNETKAARKAGMHLPLRMAEPEVVGMHFAMVDGYHLKLLHAAGKTGTYMGVRIIPQLGYRSSHNWGTDYPTIGVPIIY